jgi:hypothetical protein
VDDDAVDDHEGERAKTQLFDGLSNGLVLRHLAAMESRIEAPYRGVLPAEPLKVTGKAWQLRVGRSPASAA